MAFTHAQLDMFTFGAGLNDRDETFEGWIAFGPQHPCDSRLLFFKLRRNIIHGSGGIDVIPDHQSAGGDLTPQDHVERFGNQGTPEFGIFFSTCHHQLFKFS